MLSISLQKSYPWLGIQFRLFSSIRFRRRLFFLLTMYGIFSSLIGYGFAPFLPSANLFHRITCFRNNFIPLIFEKFFAGWERIRRALMCAQSSPASSPSRWSWPSTSAQVHQYRYCAGIFNNLWGARNRIGIGLSYRPARLHSLAELVPLIRFLGSLKV